MTDTTSIEPKVVAFVQQRELAVVKQALKAMRDCDDREWLDLALARMSTADPMTTAGLCGRHLGAGLSRRREGCR